MNSTIFPLFYAGPAAYFACLLQTNQPVLFEVNEHFTKQTYRNRINIYSSHGVQKLSIPVEKNSSKTALKDLKISFAENWNTLHWRAIVSSYQSSPYFEYYDYLLEPLFAQPATYLVDYNLQLLAIISKCLGTEINFELTKTYETHYSTDFREAFNAKKITPFDQNWQKYQQVFSYGKQPFIPNLSILDVLFNLGPESIDYLKSHRF